MVSRDTIIIIAVCGAVAALIFLVLAARFIRKASAPSNPLPPIQPLAHLREQQLARFEGTLPRSQTWYNTQNLNHLAAPQQPFGSISARGSRSSLLTKNSPVDEESATSCSPLGYEQSLPIPFFPPVRPGSTSSLGSSSEPGHPPLPASPPLDPPRPLPRTRSVSSSPGPARRTRPLSTASSHSTVHTKTSRHTLRGTPHGPHSQIQIILPAPLGTDVVTASHSQRRASRRSIVDGWTTSAEAHPIPDVPVVNN